jgi:large subunit ribosomal protein L25
MKIVKLSGSPRANVGKQDATQLRRKGNVPCVLYGGKEQVHFYADERSFKNILYTPDACFVEIDLNGKKAKAIVQESQYHKVTDKLIHVDFLEILEGKPVVIGIPVKLHGLAEGVKAGGRLVLNQRKVKAKGPAEKIPAQIDLNIDHLQIGKSITLGDIKVEGVEFLGADNTTVASVTITRAVEEVAPIAGAAAATPAADGKAAPAAADGKAAPAADKDAKTPPKK